MSILGKIKKRFEIKTIRTSCDPLFGQLTCYHTGRWEGEVFFAPVSRKVSFVIEIIPEGVNLNFDDPKVNLDERHREFFRDVEDQYPHLALQVVRALVQRYPYYTEYFTEDCVWDEFTLKSIEIGDYHGNPLSLILWYHSLTERECRRYFSFEYWQLLPSQQR